MNIRVEFGELKELDRRVKKAEKAIGELNDYLSRIKIAEPKVIETSSAKGKCILLNFKKW